jgi:hypothetical protein
VRLPFPERIPLAPAFYFAGILCVIQLLERTAALFALGCLFFVIVSVLAFNFAGGFTRPSGCYVFFFSSLTLIVGLCWKAVLGEPADSNLDNPILGIAVYLGTICSMFVAIVIASRITTKRAILGSLVTEANMQTATVGCLVTGFLIFIIGQFVPGGNGSVLSALAQINQFLPLAIVLGTIHTIRRSGGTRSVNLPVLLSGLFFFGVGIIGFSKQGIITPFVCWLMAAASQRYKVSRIQVCIGILGALFIAQYLVPYSQYGRTFRQESTSENLDVVVALLSDLGNVREQYLQQSDDAQLDNLHGYFNTQQGFLDRLQMFALDNALIDYKSHTGFDGLYPIIADFENLVPHFIWKDKPQFNTGNTFAHEVGLLSDDDTTTGVSFSPAAVAYAYMGWIGIFILAPALWIVLFALFDSLCGDLREAPWGLLVAVFFAHIAPEGGMDGVIYMYFYLSVGIIFSAVVGAYVMPVAGTLIIGPEGIIVRRGAPIRSMPNRLRPPVSSES